MNFINKNIPPTPLPHEIEDSTKSILSCGSSNHQTQTKTFSTNTHTEYTAKTVVFLYILML